MLRWLLGWQFTALLAVLTCAIAVVEFAASHFEGEQEPRAHFWFYLLMSPFWVWLTWHRYKHPRRTTAPGPDQDRELQP